MGKIFSINYRKGIAVTAGVLLIVGSFAGLSLMSGCCDDCDEPIGPHNLPPSAPDGVFSITGDGDVTLCWNPNPESDIKNYILYRNKNDGRWSKIAELDSGQDNYSDTELKPETTYSYRIIAEDKDGLESDPVESESVQSPIVETE